MLMPILAQDFGSSPPSFSSCVGDGLDANLGRDRYTRVASLGGAVEARSLLGPFESERPRPKEVTWCQGCVLLGSERPGSH